MPQPDKGKAIHNEEADGGDQIECNASAKSWISQAKSTFNPSYKMWQVSQNVCIYRVVEAIRISKPEAYAPLVVSLGPYHHKINPKFSIMDQHKLGAVHRMVARVNIDVALLIEEIKKLESEIRECYAEPIEWDGETLSWMLTMDACFILEFFKSSALRRRKSDTGCFSLVFQSNGPKNSMFYAILVDIIKLENQIPLFILITLLQLEFGTTERATTELAAMLGTFKMFSGSPFSHSLSDNAELKLKDYLEKKPAPRHLLDLYRLVIRDLLTNSRAESVTAVERDGSGGADNIGNNHGRPINVDESRSTPSAELLQIAGIEFQPGKLRFVKRRLGTSTLSLPQIKIGVNTETRLRNLMAYEQWQMCVWSSEETVITHFVRLFDNLIDSEKDVSLLRKSLVIKSWAGSDEDIARMFNRLGDGITFSSIQEIDMVMKEARDHYNNQWKVWLSQFKAEYFSKPWYVVSLVAAILILGMTAVQTVYSVKK